MIAMIVSCDNFTCLLTSRRAPATQVVAFTELPSRDDKVMLFLKVK